jgi:alkanesulfonate monooxygenase SsuD/methylene tetrahydromethanopterin reductase-like flavin-dependent oxidoreductase (luciferase family)
MFRAFDVAVADKRKLFRENLDIMRRAWRGEPVARDRDGAPVRLSPLPLQQPSPPLWVAAFGPLALKQVASLGLPYLASPLETLDVLEANYRDFHAGVAAAGHPAVTTVPVMRSVFVSGRSAEVARVKQAMLAMLPPRAREGDATLDQRVLVGDAAYVSDRLQEYRERLAMTHLVVRAGGRGIDTAAQKRSHERLLSIVTACR